MFTVIIVVCSLKSMCIQSLILIGCCVSELHGPLCPYCQRLFIVVIQELHCLPNVTVYANIGHMLGIFFELALDFINTMLFAPLQQI